MHPPSHDRPVPRAAALRPATFLDLRPALALVLALLTALAVAAPLRAETAAEKTAEAELPPLTISYVGADAIYLDGGRSHGLEVGQLVRVERDGEPIAELQVAFVSTHSASCQVIESRTEVVLGDRAVPVPFDPSQVTAATQSAAATESAPADDSGAAASGDDEDDDGKRWRSGRSEEDPWADLSGTLSVRWHSFVDGGEVPRDFDQTTLRLNLRATSIGGGPYSAKVRVRGREDRRYREDELTSRERRDRLYELALLYEPEDGKLRAQVGRLSSSPLIGFDYLDGGLAEVRFKPRFGVGGFYGQRSEIDELGLGSSGQTYGAFFHYERQRSRESPFYADVLLGGIREFEEGEVSREYVSFYGRLGHGSRWSLYQRVEVDVNGSWRGAVTGEDYQLSNLLTSASYRFSDSFRLGMSYDHRRRYRDFDNRDTPEEIFDDRLREGLRLSAQIGDPRGWRLTSSVGIRREQAGAEDAYTASGSLFHTNLADLGLLAGLDFSGFSGESADGYRVSLRTRKYFGGGHDVGLTVGTAITHTLLAELEEEQEIRWVRLNGTVRLPWRMFLLGEVEVTEGDDLAGERYILQLGYRL